MSAPPTIPSLSFHEVQVGDDATAFRTLNEEWISRYFVLEAKDHEQLGHPETILQQGGHIYLAVVDRQTVGCVALIPMGNGVYELSKMAVSPERRGFGLGRRVLQHALEQAQLLGASSLFLGSNTRLENAVRLYESAGFKHVAQDRLPKLAYSRANVFMEFNLQGTQTPRTESTSPGAARLMTDLVRKQLQQSLDTMTRVFNDEAIHTTVVEAGRITAAAMKSGKKLMVCGNGGSAADAQHLVAEFVSRLTVDRPALRAVALTTDTSILTAIGNDYSYDNVFERQVEALANEGDVLLAISTSGNSKNCMKALTLAKTMGVHTVAYTGNKGGSMAALADLNVIIPSDTTMNIQESHLALEHIFCMVVERFYFGEDFGTKPQQLAE